MRKNAQIVRQERIIPPHGGENYRQKARCGHEKGGIFAADGADHPAGGRACAGAGAQLCGHGASAAGDLAAAGAGVLPHSRARRMGRAGAARISDAAHRVRLRAAADAAGTLARGAAGAASGAGGRGAAADAAHRAGASAACHQPSGAVYGGAPAGERRRGLKLRIFRRLRQPALPGGDGGQGEHGHETFGALLREYAGKGGAGRARDRARGGDRRADANSQPQKQEQSRAHRRAGRGQDRHRGGLCPAAGGGRSAGGAARQASVFAGYGKRGSRDKIPRRI